MASSAPASTKIRFGTFEVDATSGELRKSGILLKLQPQPFRVLLLLIERAGQVVTREEIQRCLWTDSTFVDFEHGINFSINQIRAALADNAEKPRYVETLPKRGYRFIGAVEQPPAGSLSVLKRAPELALEKAAPRRWRVIAAIVSIVVAVSAAAAYFYFRKPRPLALNLDGMHIARLSGSGKAEDVAISPNGQYVVYVLRDGEKRSLNVRQVATRGDLQILPPEVVRLHGLTFSPDGNYIFFIRTDKENFKIGSLYQMPVLGGTPHALIRRVDSPVSFSPDGKQFAFVRENTADNMDELIVANADGSGERVLARPGPGPEAGPAWSPDGHTIAMTAFEYGGWSHI